MTEKALELSIRLSADTKEGRAALQQFQRQSKAAGAQAGVAFDGFTKSVANSTGGIATLSTRLKELPASIGVIGRQLASAALALTGIGGFASLAGVAALARQIAATSRELSILASLSNTTVEQFQRWAHASKKVGIEQGNLADILKDVQDKIGDFIATGGGEMADFFEDIAPRVGVTAEQFRNLSGPDALQLYVTSLERANISQSEMVFYMEAIANDGARLLPLLRNNGKALAEFGDEAQRAGVILSDDLIRQGVELDRNLATLQTTGKGLAISIGAELIPVLSRLAGEFLNARKAGLSFSESLIGIGLSNPGKSAVEQLADLPGEIERIQRGNLTEVNLFEKMAPEESIRRIQGLMRYFQLELQRDATASERAVEGLAQQLQVVESNIAHLEAARGKSGGYLNNFDKAALARFRTEAAGLQARIETLRGILAQDKKAEDVVTETADSVVQQEARKQAASREMRRTYRELWEEYVKEARTAQQKVDALLNQAQSARQAGVDRAESRRMSGMSDTERESYASGKARELTDEARRSAVFAQNAAFSGNLERAAQLAAEAAKHAERAEQYTDQITDNDVAAGLFEELGRIREEALKAQAKVQQTVAEDKQVTADLLNQRLDEMSGKISGLQQQAQGIQLQADTTQPNQAVAALEQQIDNAVRPRELKVTTMLDSVAAPAPEGFATGGMIRGPGSGTSDSILARLSNGEYVVRAAAVRRYGVDVLNKLNHLQLPRFAEGGLVASGISPSIMTGESERPQLTPVNLVFPDQSKFEMHAREDVVAEINRYFRHAVLARGSR